MHMRIKLELIQLDCLQSNLNRLSLSIKPKLSYRSNFQKKKKKCESDIQLQESYLVPPLSL